MKAFLATVLSVIAVGVLLIAYGLLAPRASAMSPAMSMVYDPQTGMYQMVRAVPTGQTFGLPESAYGYQPAVPGRVVSMPVGYTPVGYTTPADYRSVQAPVARTASPVRTSQRSVATVERARGRDWTKTALVIGGSSATGAGIGALFGGKKGALIGAAIGGGAGTLFEINKRK
jgi:hypothetical protein